MDLNAIISYFNLTKKGDHYDFYGIPVFIDNHTETECCSIGNKVYINMDEISSFDASGLAAYPVLAHELSHAMMYSLGEIDGLKYAVKKYPSLFTIDSGDYDSHAYIEEFIADIEAYNSTGLNILDYIYRNGMDDEQEYDFKLRKKSMNMYIPKNTIFKLKERRIDNDLTKIYRNQL